MDKKKKRLNYSPNKLQTALKAVDSGMPISTVSRKFNIPRTTLLYKLNGKRPEKISRPGSKCMLGEENEEKIRDWLVDSSKRGIPLSKNGLLFTAKKLFDEGHGENLVSTFSIDKGPGRKWLQAFMERHPDLSVRTAEYIHKCRSFASENSIRKWFTEVEELLGPNIAIFADPSRVYNTDETAIFLHPKSLPVIAERGQKNVYDLGKRCNKENITVLITASAGGDIAPPLALFKFERIPAVITAAAPKHWGIGRSPNGWMTCETFFEYITNVFHPYLVEKGVQLPVILVLDGHKSHISLQVSEFCSSNGIILIALPPNCTHILQPLDVAFFRPLKNDWKIILDSFKRNEGREPLRHDVPRLVNEILQKEECKMNLKNGFARCGLSPFDPDAVDYTKCLNDSQKAKTNEENGAVSNEENITSEKFLKEFERRIPACVLNDFRKNNSSFWIGAPEMKSLYHFWHSVVIDGDFQDLMNKDTTIELDIPELFPYAEFQHSFLDENDGIGYIQDDLTNTPVKDDLIKQLTVRREKKLAGEKRKRNKSTKNSQHDKNAPSTSAKRNLNFEPKPKKKRTKRVKKQIDSDSESDQSDSAFSVHSTEDSCEFSDVDLSKIPKNKLKKHFFFNFY